MSYAIAISTEIHIKHGTVPQYAQDKDLIIRNLQEQGLQIGLHVMHYFCSHFSPRQFPSVSVVKPK